MIPVVLPVDRQRLIAFAMGAFPVPRFVLVPPKRLDHHYDATREHDAKEATDDRSE